MASKRNPSDPAGPSAPKPKRPQTIELEASEVAAGPAHTSSPAHESTFEEDESSSPKAGVAWLPPGNTGMLVAAAAVGIAGALLVSALFWVTAHSSNAPEALASRLSSIEAQLRERVDRPAPARNDSKGTEELATRIERLEKSAFSPQPPSSDAALNTRVDDLANAVRELHARADAMQPVDKSEFDALNNRIAALEKSAGTMETEIGKRATVASDRAVRLALATSALRAAVERGEPFSGELAAARPLASDNAFTALEPFATSGVPSNALLARELASLVPALRTAVNSMPVEGGFFERMKNNAGRLIRIRPVDEISGDDPAAVITRIELKAASADVAGALADIAKLPAPVQTPAQSWIDKAQARIAAIQSSRQIAADAIGALGKATP
jgi:hypothetical protein